MDFWTLAADSWWNDAALEGVFIKGLNKQLKDELTAHDEPIDLPSLVSLAFQLDNHLRERRQEKTARPLSPAPSFQPRRIRAEELTTVQATVVSPVILFLLACFVQKTGLVSKGGGTDEPSSR